IRRLEVKRINILIFFGRIFRVLDGTVGALDEPVWMFRDPGMVGRALERYVKCELHIVRASNGDQMFEVSRSAKLLMNRSVATIFGADSPWAAGVARRCD